MAAYDIPILTRHLDRDEILDLVHSLDPALSQNVRFRESQPFLGSVEAAVLASLTAGGTAIVVALINGLFLLWSQRLARSQPAKAPQRAKPLVVVRTPRLMIHIRSAMDVPGEKDLGEERVLEIRLQVET